jgi:tRNA G18 (ribose-2'-O)-methylase SpoU
MTLRQFGSTEEAIRTLREKEGCLIYASDLNPESMDVRNLNWDVDIEPDSNNDEPNQRTICVVMGNEERGISHEMRKLADETL